MLNKKIYGLGICFGLELMIRVKGFLERVKLKGVGVLLQFRFRVIG